MIRLLIIYILNFSIIYKLNNFILFYFDDIIIFIIVFTYILFYFLILKKFNYYIINIIYDYEIDLYFYNKINYYYSIINILFFLIFYFLNFRLIVFFSKKNLDLNIFEIKTKIVTQCCNYSNNYYLILIIFLGLIFFIIYTIIYILFRIVFLITKYHFLKIHYFVFRRIMFYNNLIDKLKNLELKTFELLGHNYYYYLFFRKYFMTIIIIVLLLKGIFFMQGNLSNFLFFVPYYGLYQYFFNLYIFIVTKFKIDFEILIMELYYIDLNHIIERNEEKKKLYKKYLISNHSEYKFEDSVYFFFPTEIKKNYLLVQTNRYTINKFPNDFFSLIQNYKPKLIVKDSYK